MPYVVNSAKGVQRLLYTLESTVLQGLDLGSLYIDIWKI